MIVRYCGYILWLILLNVKTIYSQNINETNAKEMDEVFVSPKLKTVKINYDLKKNAGLSMQIEKYIKDTFKITYPILCNKKKSFQYIEANSLSNEIAVHVSNNFNKTGLLHSIKVPFIIGLNDSLNRPCYIKVKIYEAISITNKDSSCNYSGINIGKQIFETILVFNINFMVKTIHKITKNNPKFQQGMWLSTHEINLHFTNEHILFKKNGIIFSFEPLYNTSNNSFALGLYKSLPTSNNKLNRTTLFFKKNEGEWLDASHLYSLRAYKKQYIVDSFIRHTIMKQKPPLLNDIISKNKLFFNNFNKERERVFFDELFDKDIVFKSFNNIEMLIKMKVKI